MAAFLQQERGALACHGMPWDAPWEFMGEEWETGRFSNRKGGKLGESAAKLAAIPGVSWSIGGISAAAARIPGISWEKFGQDFLTLRKLHVVRTFVNKHQIGRFLPIFGRYM
ncbi:hypothetical protein [Pacificoceanicola onchidii]|uniref:hypothetical protein n=1 Tax=Pacificoceanicola onchidii TaxID=2562685 RepID=UPI0010A313A1|nr:hypothetical protein [Pacificoceanicola onchidii]